jgi:epoxide hydrolase 4
MITDPRSRTGRRRLLVSGAALAAAGLPGGVRAAAEPAFAEGYATSDDGARLYLVRAGDGPLVLFLHGHPDSWALYDAQIRELARDHLAAAPNLRGYPPSDAPDPVEAYGMPRLLGDVHALLDHLGRERCAALVGNDWGGYVAWVFASAYPSRVERLVILNAQHPAVHLRLIRTDPAHNRAARYERAFHAAPAPYPPWYNYYRADPIKVPVSVEEAAREPAPDLAAAFFAGVARPPAATSLRVEVPTLVLWGMRDPFMLPGQLDGLPEHVPDLTVVRIGDAGHRPMRSHPELVNRALRDFLGRSGSR